MFGANPGLHVPLHAECLSSCLTPLPPGIDDLREKREEILKQLKEDESEKNKIQQDVGGSGGQRLN
jgi:hypothetical protein